jgi:predicted DCC family thiol-disulfide oxidoreductase YuxK
MTYGRQAARRLAVPRPGQSSESSAPRPILLYDGACGFCARSVPFALRHEGARTTLRFARLDGETGSAVRLRHPELSGADSLLTPEQRARFVDSDDPV